MNEITAERPIWYLAPGGIPIRAAAGKPPISVPDRSLRQSDGYDDNEDRYYDRDEG